MKNGIKVSTDVYYDGKLPGGYKELWTTDGRFLSDNHRIDGPAVYYGGIVQWWVRGDTHTSEASYQEAAGLSDEDMSILILKYSDIY